MDNSTVASNAAAAASDDAGSCETSDLGREATHDCAATKPEADSDGGGTVTVSPSPSSRASTVFSPPWDTQPMGLYISDLIKLSQPACGAIRQPSSKSGGSDGTTDFRRRTVAGPLSERYSPVEQDAHEVQLKRETRKEFQNLLWFWKNSSSSGSIGGSGTSCAREFIGADSVADELLIRASDSSSSATTGIGEGENGATVQPPPLPTRRRRQRAGKQQQSRIRPIDVSAI